jgi:hypothetical protein
MKKSRTWVSRWRGTGVWVWVWVCGWEEEGDEGDEGVVGVAGVAVVCEELGRESGKGSEVYGGRMRES